MPDPSSDATAPPGSAPADDGLLGAAGYRQLHQWAPAATARARAAELVTIHRSSLREVVRNPHADEEWAQTLVRAPRLVNAVRDLIGPDIAVENTFLVVKWPGRDFEVPWHQDGINDRLELDPLHAVAAWIALTDADVTTGCLHVAPGSQRAGYLPYEREAATGADRGRALGTHVSPDTRGMPVPVAAGSGVLMDTRLVHCSHSNQGVGARFGLNIRYVAPGGIRRRDGSSPGLHPITGTGW
ncbi:phytanoyl-CoA dioxygenase family protein [Streptomyces justiciae]|uniref:Phytanoyl-CoA dioxygenase family protein n=1 Tax=Streptomyces justiciae TaxID=2780140 RepID=A0ABU3M648_9ACTN|nr:phytanoyl-CoA dioxygenase family protein [Streptomyces justiciae]MDT7846989.1 phytanoyl-CoA dioxygenase family protein [Streptomyces justiciae]